MRVSSPHAPRIVAKGQRILFPRLRPVFGIIDCEKPAVKAPVKKAAIKAVKKIAKKSARASIKGNSAAAMPLSKRANQKAVITSRRIAASGLTSRIRGHISASGRRNQAARSSRKRS